MRHLPILVQMLMSSKESRVLKHSIRDEGIGIIVFRGTLTLADVWNDIDVRPRQWPPNENEEKVSDFWVHGGFAKVTRNTWNDESHNVDDFVDKHDKIVLGGHSLGGCCAFLSAAMIQTKYPHK